MEGWSGRSFGGLLAQLAETKVSLGRTLTTTQQAGHNLATFAEDLELLAKK